MYRKSLSGAVLIILRMIFRESRHPQVPLTGDGHDAQLLFHCRCVGGRGDEAAISSRSPSLMPRRDSTRASPKANAPAQATSSSPPSSSPRSSTSSPTVSSSPPPRPTPPCRRTAWSGATHSTSPSTRSSRRSSRLMSRSCLSRRWWCGITGCLCSLESEWAGATWRGSIRLAR